MRAPPMDWRGFLTDWVWPVVYTTVAAVASPVAIFIATASSGDGDIWSFILFMAIYAAANVILFGIPVTLLLQKFRRESAVAYIFAGLIGSWIIPIASWISATSQTKTAEQILYEGNSDLLILLSGIPIMGLSMIATTTWWFCNRRPKLWAAGIIPPPRGYHFRLF